ncbi:hypothetical protein [Ferruginivarius sediminum]|uniref:Uncharacterized protein n=1 Tax=Ferruginivarius sediminum TaxID=2661937 RepID=A0A369TEP7_9PROT|nr:hypothetical protein [Ferruginivarius sediminum]RDD63819.1 hypothetical protein DRB17_01235 [Ferruginivarius sediminum]
MTLINTTLRPRRGALSADSQWYITQSQPARSTGDAAADTRAALTGDGTPGTAIPYAQAPKLLALPTHRVVIGFGGGMATSEILRASLEAAPAGFDELRRSLPEHMRRACTEAAARAGVMVAMLGWSMRDGRVRGLVVTDEGKVAELPDGPACHPPLDPDVPCSAAGWLGDDPATLRLSHLRFAEHQWRTWQEGRYAAGFALGGTLQLATVDEHGAEVRDIGHLDALAAAAEAA